MTRDVDESNIRFVRSLYEATSAGEWNTAAAMVTEDFCITEAPSLPFGGVFRGIPGLQQLYAIVMSSLGVTAIDLVEITAGDGRVAVFCELRCEDLESRLTLVETFRFRDGKVCEIKPYYFDHAPIWAVYNARKSKAGHV